MNKGIQINEKICADNNFYQSIEAKGRSGSIIFKGTQMLLRCTEINGREILILQRKVHDYMEILTAK